MSNLKERLNGIETSHVKVTYRHPRTGEAIIKINSRQMMENKAIAWEHVVSVEAHETPGYWEMPENKETELDRQWRIDGGR